MYTPTNTELARAYVRTHKSDTIYTRGTWYRYDLGVWSPLHDLSVESEIWKLMEKYEMRDQLRPNLSIFQSILRYLKSEMHMKESCIDSRPNFINLQNGIYDLELGALLSHNPAYYLTTQLSFSYDRNATHDTWDYFLQTSLVQKDCSAHDPELANFVQEAVGYSLTDDVSHHITFWCPGVGANGKGTLFKVIEKLAGTAAVPLNVNILRKEQYQLAGLAGKRIALCSEANATDNLVEDAIVKSLVAGDTMTVRQIHREPFELTPQVKLWWSMNKLPNVGDTSKGFWRRVKVIPFNRNFEPDEIIIDLPEQLFKELPGIFNWAMTGLQRLKMRGNFEIPAQVELETKEYMEESNVVGMFVEDQCIAGTEVLSSVLYENYKAWCFDNGYKPFSIKSFKREMEALKYYYVHDHTGRFFRGLRLKI